MKTFAIEYNGKHYGYIERDNEEEAEYSAALLIKQTGIRLVNRGLLFVTEV